MEMLKNSVPGIFQLAASRYMPATGGKRCINQRFPGHETGIGHRHLAYIVIFKRRANRRAAGQRNGIAVSAVTRRPRQ
jgi:hypothetical protein